MAKPSIGTSRNSPAADAAASFRAADLLLRSSTSAVSLAYRLVRNAQTTNDQTRRTTSSSRSESLNIENGGGGGAAFLSPVETHGQRTFMLMR